MSSDSLQAVLRVVDVLEELGVRYHFGGSWASSIHGVPRQTRDLDLVVDLPHSLVPILVSRLQSEFYLDEERILHAIQRHSSFNMIYLATGFKIDVFLHGPGEFDRLEFERSGPQRIGADQEREVVVKSPEDTLLRKLQWYRIGGETSERQWTDVLGIVKEQGGRLDREYMRRWAGDLGVSDLLERALGSQPVASSRIQALKRMTELLELFGVANDAEDHGSGAEATELRNRATEGIRAIAAEHPVVHEIIPNLEEILERGLLVFSWPTVLKRVELEIERAGQRDLEPS